MAEAKITLTTIANDEGLKELNTELAKGQQEVKKLQKELKDLEKATANGTKATAEQAKQMQDLRLAINQQSQANKALNKQISEGVNAMTQSKTAAKGLCDTLKDMAKQKLGVDLEALQGLNFGLVGVATAATTVATALVNSGREVSALSNQFISFAGSAKQAEQMYNRFNDVYRNTNYDEQKVYDMAKALMRIGVSANESAELIEKVSDASAKLGQGVEFTEQLTQAMAKLRVGGELSQKQLVELAKAGIDLTDVQDQMKQGGVAAYEALKGKLDQYKGGMAETKQTAAEMEGDIKGNLIEIGRQTALLVDDFFGFSDALKAFYQWVIDVSQTVIDKIKSMRNALAQNMAAADEYGRAMQEWEDIYGDSFQGNDTQRAAAAAAYANACADIAKEKEAEAQAEAKLVTLEQARAQVKVAGGGSVSSGGGGSASGSTIAKEADPFQEMMKQHQAEMEAIQAELDFKLACREIDQASYDEMMAMRRESNNAWIEAQLQDEALTLEQKVALWKQYISKTTEMQKQQSTEVSEFNKRFASTFSSAMTDCIMGAKSFGEAFKEILKQLLQQLIQCAIYSLIISSMMPGGVGANFGKVFKGGMGFASGGLVTGPGSSTSDSIPTRLSNGEYVLNAQAVDRIGVGNLDAINSGSPVADASPIGASSITLNVSAMDADSFSDFLGRGGLTSIKEAMFADDLNFASI